MGEAIVKGEELNLPPLGKLKVAREKTTPRGMSYILRLVRNGRTTERAGEADT